MIAVLKMLLNRIFQVRRLLTDKNIKWEFKTYTILINLKISFLFKNNLQDLRFITESTQTCSMK